MLKVRDEPLLMFLALMALYSPLAALSAYMPVVARLKPEDQVKLAFALFFNVVIFVLAAVWVGEPLLELLGISTAALSVTGGIALLYAGVPMMRGLEEAIPEQHMAEGAAASVGGSWRDVLFTPVTFPLTVGGTSFGMIVAFASSGETFYDGLHFTVVGVCYAAVTGFTLYLAGHANRLASPQTRLVIARVAGILLTAIAVMLIASGGSKLVLEAIAGQS